MAKPGNQRRRAPALQPRSARGSNITCYSVVASLGRLLRKPWASLLTDRRDGAGAGAAAGPVGGAGQRAAAGRAGAGRARDRRVPAAGRRRGAGARRWPTCCARAATWPRSSGCAPEQALAQLRQRDDLAAAIDALGEDAARAALPQALRVIPRDDERALAAGAAGAAGDRPRAARRALARSACRRGWASARGWCRCWPRCWGWARCWWSATPCAWTSSRDARKSACCSCWAPATASCAALSSTSVPGTGSPPARWRWASSPWRGWPCRRRWPRWPRSYGSSFALQGLDPLAAACVLAGAGLLGWLGAGLVTGHYLRQTRPREH